MTSSQSSVDQKRSISEIVSETFPPFDHRVHIVSPFEQERLEDAIFQEKLNEKLLDLMIEFHVWSSARPAHEREKTIEHLEGEINSIIDTEKEQGRSIQLSYVEQTRQRLAAFIDQIKSALATLTGSF